MSDTNDFIEQLINNDNIAAKETFETLIATKAFDQLQNYREIVASNMFTGKKDTTED
jgi:hypothetical protein